MDESRLLRTLDQVDQLVEPDPAFLGRLYGEAMAELGLPKATRPGTRHLGPARPTRRLPRGKRTRWPLLLIAALLTGGALAGLGVGALRNRLAVDRADLLMQVRSAGRVTIAIRPDHPQFAIGGQAASGFDVDVAQEVARRLGVSPIIVVVDAEQMLSSPNPTSWSIAFPSVGSWTIPTAQFASSSPYYAWPHLVVVPEASTAATLGQLTFGAVCAVSGDGGEAWLRGQYGGSPSPALPGPILSRPSDDACLAAVASGVAVAAVTADLTEGDLTARGGLRAISGPDPEPRVIVVRASDGKRPDPSGLVAAIDAALEAMHQDGTLTRLSQNRFGLDLTSP